VTQFTYASTASRRPAAPVVVSEGATAPAHVILFGSPVRSISYSVPDPDLEDAQLARTAMAEPGGKDWSVVKRSLGL
jgi:hypothetical protein